MRIRDNGLAGTVKAALGGVGGEEGHKLILSLRKVTTTVRIIAITGRTNAD
jgi:hypothetical protein